MSLARVALDQKIRQLFSEIYSSQNEVKAAPSLDDETILLETGLDSLGFAILVTRLEEELNYDPFSLVQEAYYPSTYKQFLDFYFTNQSQ